MNTQDIIPFAYPCAHPTPEPGLFTAAGPTLPPLFTNTGYEKGPTMASIIGQMDLPGNPTPKECATMEAMLRSGTPF